MSLGDRVVPKEEGHTQDARLAAGKEGCIHSLYPTPQPGGQYDFADLHQTSQTAKSPPPLTRAHRQCPHDRCALRDAPAWPSSYLLWSLLLENVRLFSCLTIKVNIV